jgi:predicted nucleic acid-binding protein
MVLVDTSVWISHFRVGEPVLNELLGDGYVLMHPYVSGELACGSLRHRTAILSDLRSLPEAERASDDEVMRMIEQRRLWGRGLGWVDCHLLAAALISHCRFWTLDRALARAASDSGLRVL